MVPTIDSEALGDAAAKTLNPTREQKAVSGFIQSSVVPLCVYIPLATIVAFAVRDSIRADAVSYIRHAEYLCSGRLLDSVSGYWSPLISWSLAPFLYLGFDGLYASRLVLGLWGAVLVVAACVFVRTVEGIKTVWNFPGVLTALMAVQLGSSFTTPDVVLGSVLVFYFTLTATQPFLESFWRPFSAGLLGGLAYLAKSYALPFFLVHFTSVVFLHYGFERVRVTKGRAFRAWAYGLLAFAIIAGPWIGILTHKYGRFTFSSVAAFSHYLVGPVEDPEATIYRIQQLPPGRIAIWETPELMDYENWSCVESWSNFKHLIGYMLRNGARILRCLDRLDYLCSFPSCAILMSIIALAGLWKREVFLLVWLLVTAGIYAGGFLPNVFEARHIIPILYPVCCARLFGFIHASRKRLRPTGPTSPRGVREILFAFSCIFFLSFAVRPATYIASALGPDGNSDAVWRKIGEVLRTKGCIGPVAASEKFYREGLYISYHLKQPFVGCPPTSKVEEVQKVLGEYKVETFVMHSGWSLSARFLAETRWRLAEKLVCGENEVFVFVRP